MSNITVSVVMVTYKHEQFIRAAVLSVIEQIGDFELELIVADDLSPDHTPDIVNELIANHPYGYRIKYTRHTYNKGMMPNFIWALEQCKGKYVALCDGDDYWTDPYKLQKQVDFLEKNPEYVITGHDSTCIDKNGAPVNHQYIPEKFKSDCPSNQLKKGFWIATLTMCFRNLPVLKNYPHEAYHIKNGDTFLICVLGQFGNYKYMTDIKPAAYRVHAGGIWSLNNSLANAVDQKHTEVKLVEYFTRIGDLETAAHFKKDILNICNQNIFSAAWQNRNRQLFYAYFIKTFLYFVASGQLKRAVNNLKTLIKYSLQTNQDTTTK
jgi:glycosyltransferase involved in cell wall biosynthesis